MPGVLSTALVLPEMVFDMFSALYRTVKTRSGEEYAFGTTYQKGGWASNMLLNQNGGNVASWLADLAGRLGLKVGEGAVVGGSGMYEAYTYGGRGGKSDVREILFQRRENGDRAMQVEKVELSEKLDGALKNMGTFFMWDASGGILTVAALVSLRFY